MKELTDFVKKCEEEGELHRIKTEVDWNLELSHIAKLNEERKGPALLFENVKADPNEVIVVDGLRLPSDVEYLSQLKGFKLLYVEAQSETRYKRVVARNENPGDAEKTFDQFVQDQKDEADSHILGLRDKAYRVISNDGSLEELYKNVDSLISSLQKQ